MSHPGDAAGGGGSRDGWDPTRPLSGLEREPRRADPDDVDAGGAEPSERAPGRERRMVDEGADEADDRGDDGGRVLLPHLERLSSLATRSAAALEASAEQYARWVLEAFRAGGKVLLCGNGGSAATVEHVAAEYVVRFRRRREPLPAIALTASGPLLTAAANDFGFEELFARQIRGLAGPDDLVVLHSTSGESENLLRAADAASESGLRTVAVLASGGGRLAQRVDLALVVPTDEAPRAQEVQLAIEHAVVDRVDTGFSDEEGGDG